MTSILLLTQSKLLANEVVSPCREGDTESAAVEANLHVIAATISLAHLHYFAFCWLEN